MMGIDLYMMLMNVFELQIKTKFEGCDPGNAKVRV